MMFKKEKPIVSFMIVGAQKSGTTSLHYYLNQIDGILGSNPKETDFFSYDSLYKRGYKFYHKNFFKDFVKGDMVFDASVEYMYLPYVAKRLYKYNSNLRLILCLRDPIERAISAYKMYKYINSDEGVAWKRNYLNHLKNHSKKYFEIGENFYCKRPFPKFEEIIDDEFTHLDSKFDYRFYEPSLIKRGLYKQQIDNILRYFPLNQILFISSSKLRKEPKKEIYRILNFLNIDSNIDGIDFSIKLSNLSNDEIEVSENTMNRLRKIFCKYNDGLETFYKL
jgi:Sulfotransferase domain